MKLYTIRVEFSKDYQIEAETEQEALDLAFDMAELDGELSAYKIDSYDYKEDE